MIKTIMKIWAGLIIIFSVGSIYYAGLLDIYGLIGVALLNIPLIYFIFK